MGHGYERGKQDPDKILPIAGLAEMVEASRNHPLPPADGRTINEALLEDDQRRTLVQGFIEKYKQPLHLIRTYVDRITGIAPGTKQRFRDAYDTTFSNRIYRSQDTTETALKNLSHVIDSMCYLSYIAQFQRILKEEKLDPNLINSDVMTNIITDLGALKERIAGIPAKREKTK